MVLTRKKYERLVLRIGSKFCVVQVIAAENGRARLGIIAPSDVEIHREEIARRIGYGEVIDGMINPDVTLIEDVTPVSFHERYRGSVGIG